jgi:hypothetical protein
MRQVGKLAKEIVVDRTSRGFGVSQPEGNKEKLKSLSTEYKRDRRRLKKQGKLASQTTPTKSNLTKSRQMLDSVDFNGQKGKAEVFLNDNRAETKAQLQARQDRKFMNLSKDETKQVVKLLEEKIINDIKKKGL